MARTPRVVIIGAGITGCALADELSARGWSDITVLEQGPLFTTGGHTSQAPGPVFRTTGSKTMTGFANYTVDKYAELTLDGEQCFHPVGGLEVAVSESRWADLKRRHGWATSWGVESYLCSPEECAALNPMLAADRLIGGFHIPGDGLVRPSRAAEAQARRAMDRGVRFLAWHTVTGVERHAGRVRGVTTDQGGFRADVIVSCAGMRAPAIGELVELDVPLVPMVHQYAKTAPVPRSRGQREQDGSRLEATSPLLRHQEAGLYFLEHADRIGIGSYGHRPMPVSQGELAAPAVGSVPTESPFTAEEFDSSWARAVALLPGLADTKVEERSDGLLPFTADGNPLLGEHPEMEGFWVAEAVRISHSAGVAKAMAEWLVDGQPGVDVRACELNRFEPAQLAPEYVEARSSRTFAEVYDIVHPLRPMEHPRPLRTSPFYEREVELGAHFLESTGWERPQWYESNAELPEVEQIPPRNDWAAQYYSPISGAEALVTRERVAMFDLTSLKRFEVSGPEALAFLQTLTTNQIDRSPGSVTYSLLLGEDGGIRSDLTVARLAEDRFQVGANSNLDLNWLQRHLPPGGKVQLRDITAGTCCIGLWGPRARLLLQPLIRQDISPESMGIFTAKKLFVGDVPVTAMRLSYVGELGWELYTTADLGRKLWDTLWEAGQDHGVIAAGRGALDSLRLEKGYRASGVDMTTEHDPFEAGVGFAVRMDKGYFIGRDVLVGRSPATASRKLTCLIIDDDYQVVMGGEPVLGAGEPVGYVTSAARGYTIGRNIAYAWLPAGVAVPGNEVAIEYFGEKVPAVVAEEPLFDPGMTRLRG
ncbi:GcvT family protein [Amycolatopsis palatopharyngis]|uniref:GcvT family protein n=1 Tax=Amycolatopsis palatopharyngis TaxID=187982 RepID=UPI000E22B10F|nr:FAD-dependent oxidoreductase [Amycolatopsis palatopharyngis]